METWVAVLLLLGLGVALLLLEIIFVPGTTLVGVAGVICSVIGVVISFRSYGVGTGLLVLLGAAAITGGGLWYALKQQSWRRFALHDQNQGRVNDRADLLLQPGMKGITRSTLRPYGMAEFDAGIFEVFAPSGAVVERTPVRVVRVEHGKVTVEPLTENPAFRKAGNG